MLNQRVYQSQILTGEILFSYKRQSFAILIIMKMVFFYTLDSLNVLWAYLSSKESYESFFLKVNCDNIVSQLYFTKNNKVFESLTVFLCFLHISYT